MNYEENITAIRIVYEALGDLRNKVAFVGGVVVPLYSDTQSIEARFTSDVDVIIELLNYSSLARLEEQLVKMGFQNDIESRIICRYKIKGITVDIMSTTLDTFGFSNKWYPEGYKYSIQYQIGDNYSIKILNAPYFIATKFEAFKDRGKNDGRTSQDFEDIIYILENRRGIWEEIVQLSGEIKEYLILEFSKLLKNPYIIEWIDCHVERASPPSTYLIINEIEKIVRSR